MADSTDGMMILTTTGQDEPDAGQEATATGDLAITENPAAGVFEATRDGETVAGVVYSRSGDRVTLLATSVFPAFRGQGIAGMLLSGVLDRLRAEGATATLSCSFATEFVEAHPEYADVLESSSLGGTAR